VFVRLGFAHARCGASASAIDGAGSDGDREGESFEFARCVRWRAHRQRCFFRRRLSATNVQPREPRRVFRPRASISRERSDEGSLSPSRQFNKPWRESDPFGRRSLRSGSLRMTPVAFFTVSADFAQPCEAASAQAELNIVVTPPSPFPPPPSPTKRDRRHAHPQRAETLAIPPRLGIDLPSRETRVTTIAAPTRRPPHAERQPIDVRARIPRREISARCAIAMRERANHEAVLCSSLHQSSMDRQRAERLRCIACKRSVVVHRRRGTTRRAYVDPSRRGRRQPTRAARKISSTPEASLDNAHRPSARSR
jgi:hypothetical protein